MYSHANARYARLRAYANPILALRQELRSARLVPRSKKEKTDHRWWSVFSLAAELGFEPRHTESESAVLPLHNSARLKAHCCIRNNIQSLPLGINRSQIVPGIQRTTAHLLAWQYTASGMQSLLCYLYTIPLDMRTLVSCLYILSQRNRFVK